MAAETARETGGTVNAFLEVRLDAVDPFVPHERCDEAELFHCSAHGLHKAGAVSTAENGATTHQLMAIFGWRTLKEAERYTRAAQQKRFAGGAMRMIVPAKA